MDRRTDEQTDGQRELNVGILGVKVYIFMAIIYLFYASSDKRYCKIARVRL